MNYRQIEKKKQVHIDRLWRTEKKTDTVISNDTDNKDYYNVHKMCVELDIINQDTELKSSSNDFLLLKKENINVNDVMKDENYIEIKVDSIKIDDIKLINEHESEYSKLEEIRVELEKQKQIDKEQISNQESHYSQLEEIRVELEKQLGQVILTKVYKIIEESVFIL